MASSAQSTIQDKKIHSRFPFLTCKSLLDPVTAQQQQEHATNFQL